MQLLMGIICLVTYHLEVEVYYGEVILQLDLNKIFDVFFNLQLLFPVQITNISILFHASSNHLSYV